MSFVPGYEVAIGVAPASCLGNAPGCLVHPEVDIRAHRLQNDYSGAVPESDPDRSVERPFKQMTPFERTAAGILGLIVGGVGLVALLKSENQVGTGVALLLAGVLLLIGIQGTPLIRFGSGDHSFEMEPRRQEIAKLATALSGTDPRQAEALIEGFAVADPASRDDPKMIAVMGFVYREQVRAALARLRIRDSGWSISENRSDDDSHGSYFVNQPDMWPAIVDVIGVFTSNSAKIHQDVATRLAKYMGRPIASNVVIATNSSTAAQFASEIVARGHSKNIDIIQWNTQKDNDALLDAIERAAASGPQE